MATQGLVTVIKSGVVLQKIVVGCDGYNAPPLAEGLAELIKGQEDYPALEEVYRLALEKDFGCENCLVVMDAARILHEGDEEDDQEEVMSRYRATFEDPAFNPRWKHGIADYTYTITDGTVERIER